ncbi:MAG: ZIP family metal transporter [ANME-2 cluster archaeon]|nr:ZIP family metal transporter [ANME-2 cluster archaeon]
MNTLQWIIAATLFVSLISLIGIVTFSFSDRSLKKVLLVLVGFSAGTLMGGSFLHLLPEALKISSSKTTFNILILGFILFFLLEKIVWRHCHKDNCEIHSFAYLNLFGDAAHNLIDGFILAAAFLANIPLGIATTLAVAAHEIPQEIGDFGVLIYGGFGKKKALAMNLVTALTALLGGLIGYYMSSYIDGMMNFLLPFAAGGFLYIAAVDLLPELHKETDKWKTTFSFFSFIAGIGIMWLLRFLFEG